MSHDDASFNNSRRNLFRQLLRTGAFSTLAQVGYVSELLASSLLSGLVQQAIAEENKTESNLNYLNIGMLGAPLRYQFDHWLRTSPSDPEILLNSITGTKLKIENDHVVGTELGYFNHNGVLVPNLFSQSANLSNGLMQFSDILKHMIVIRGFGTGVDGHPTNFIRQHSPIGGVSSIAALAAESSQRTFDVVQWPNRQGWSNYFSKAGKTINVLSGNDPAGNLISGFRPPGDTLSTARTVASRNQEVVDLAKRRLLHYVKSEAPGAKVLAKNHKNAIGLIKKGVENFNAFWSPAVARYTEVIHNSVRQIEIAGFSDKPLIFSPDNPWQGHHRELSLAERKRLWKIGAGEEIHLKPDSDLRQIVKSATIDDLATGLAIAEYIFSEKLSSSIEIRSSRIENLDITKADGTTQTFHLDHDMHETGAPVAVFVMNQYYRGLLAGLSELRSRLTAITDGNRSIWSKTMVHFVSDFERWARSNGSGSDHGFNQMVQSVIGGHVTDGPHVVGNVLKSSPHSSYAGSQGHGAPISGYNQSGMPNQVMAASTVASIMQVEHNPYENVADSLCEFESGKIKIKYPSKIVEGGS